MSEYLAKAGDVISGGNKEWLHKQQERLKSNRVMKVLKEIEDNLGSQENGEGPGAVRACERYIKNRITNLDYQGAMALGLPIGSGEVESGHKSVIQARLKVSGAWWKEGNAENMLALRAMRASGEWQSYWDSVRQAAS
jgi:hypothetical protein